MAGIINQCKAALMRIGYLFYLFISLSVCGRLVAQTNDSIKTKDLDSVEIIAPLSAPSHYLSTVPSQSLNSEYFLKQGIQSLSDAVKFLNGAILRDYGGIGGIKTVAIRGMGSEHTAVAYDGIVVSNAQSGQVDIGRFALDNISYISLEVGQTDDIFQTARTFASSGVLNIQTAKPQFEYKNYEGYAKIIAGAWGQFNPTINYAHKINPSFSVSANVNWQRADGIYSYKESDGRETIKKKRKNSDVDILKTELNIFNDWGKNGQLDTKIYFYDSERGLPGAAILYKDYAGERLWDNTFFIQTSYKKNIGQQLTLKTQAKYNNAYSKYQNIDATGKATDYYREQEIYLSNALKYAINKNFSLSFAEDLSYNVLDTKFSMFGSNAPLPKRYNSLTLVAGQYSTKRLSINAHLLATYISEKVKNNQSDHIYKRLSPSISFSYQLFEDQKLRIRGLYKQGFRVPSFNELYYTSVQKSLNPEKSNQVSIGATWMKDFTSPILRHINFSVDAYINKVNDKIVVIPTTFVPRTLNLGKVDIKGLDARLSTNIEISDNINIDISANYSYISAVDKTDKSKKGYNDQIAYTPANSGGIAFDMKTSILNISYSALFYGVRYTQVGNQDWDDNIIKGYSDHSVSIYKSVPIRNNQLYLQAGLTNIFNKSYQIIKSYPMPGRAYKITIGYKF